MLDYVTENMMMIAGFKSDPTVFVFILLFLFDMNDRLVSCSLSVGVIKGGGVEIRRSARFSNKIRRSGQF